MSDPAMVDGRRVRGAKRRAALMGAAASVLAREGIDAVTHRAVASASGSSLASVTYHFPTIGGLKGAIFSWTGDRVLEAMERAATISSQSGADTAEIAGEFAYRLCAEQRELTVVLLQLLVAASADPELQPIVDRLNRRAETILAPAVGEDVAPMVVASIQGAIMLALARGTNAAEWARDAVRTVIRQFTLDSHQTDPNEADPSPPPSPPGEQEPAS